MPPDAKTLEVKLWLTKASSDIAAGLHGLTAIPPFTVEALFHAQKAAEKALKGFLIWHEVTFRKVHDIRLLGEEVTKLDPTLTPCILLASDLTPYAVMFRYPGEASEPSLSEAQDALQLAGTVISEILKRLPPDTHPKDRTRA